MQALYRYMDSRWMVHLLQNNALRLPKYSLSDGNLPFSKQLEPGPVDFSVKINVTCTIRNIPAYAHGHSSHILLKICTLR
jgi:hypothetical protein